MRMTSLQRKCSQRLISKFRAGRRAALLQLPTGQGKSLVAADVFDRWARPAGLNLVLVTPANKPLSAGWLAALELDPQSGEAKRAGVPFRLSRSVGRPANACRITMGQLTRYLHAGGRPREDWQCWLAERVAFVVVDEFHRSKRWRHDLAYAFEHRAYDHLAKWCRPGRGRRPVAPAWLLLSATPYNPVELDFQLDRPTQQEGEVESDVAKEVRALGREVKATLYALAALDDIRDSDRRNAVKELVGEVHAALANGGEHNQTTISRGPLVIVPGATHHLRPRSVVAPFDTPKSSSVEEDIRRVQDFHRRIFKGAKRPPGFVSLAERLVLAGVRPSRKGHSLEGHRYGRSTTEAVRKGALPKTERLAMQQVLITVVKKSIEAGDKVLVFCSHRAVVEATTRLLRQNLHGLSPSDVAAVSSGVAEGNARALQFHQQASAPRILVTSDINSESVDLHGNCRTLVHFELPWTPLRVMQRYGRLWRLMAGGRQRTPRVFHTVHPGGVGEEILNRLERRWRYLTVLGIDYVDFKTALGVRVPAVPWGTP